MANRVELKDMDLQNVVGGAFNFYTHARTGEPMIYVDGVGGFSPTSSKSQEQIIIMCAQNDGLDQITLANMALANGYMVPYAG